MDNVKLAYRGTKNATDTSRRENYFLLISQFKDTKGNAVNVPIYIDEKGQYNRVFIDTNKITTAFGRDDFLAYIQKEIRNGNLVRIKSKSIQASERTALIADGYSKNASVNTVTQNDTSVKYTTKAQRTGCSMCGFGIHIENRPHRFDRLREDNPKEWEYWMYRCVTDPVTGEKYGWGRVLDYIGVEWEDEYIDWDVQQIRMEDFL